MDVELDALQDVLVKRARRSKTQHYSDIRHGLFTPPVYVGPNRVGWPKHETAAINAAVCAGASADEIRALVKQLTAARPHLGDERELRGQREATPHKGKTERRVSP
jgi:hypothetical protein